MSRQDTVGGDAAKIRSLIELLEKRIRRCQPPRGAGSSERASVECERNRMKFELADLRAALKTAGGRE